MTPIELRHRYKYPAGKPLFMKVSLRSTSYRGSRVNDIACAMLNERQVPRECRLLFRNATGFDTDLIEPWRTICNRRASWIEKAA